VVVAVEEGRRILANIRRFLSYALSGGLAEILVLLVAPFVGVAIPLVPAQILWINMITHGLPGVAFGAEPVDPKVMTEPPSSPGESVLGNGLIRLILVGGTSIAVMSTAAAVAAMWWDQPVTTSVFVVLGLAQLALALALRARRADGKRRRFGLEWALLGAAIAQLAAVYLPPLQELLSTQPLQLDWLVALTLLACMPAMIVQAASPYLAPKRIEGEPRQVARTGHDRSTTPEPANAPLERSRSA
jgi:Ca2+-transporting ATPase